MIAFIDRLLPTVFALAAILYLWLAARIFPGAGQARSRAISYFLFLIAVVIAGSGLRYGASEPALRALGRVLSLSGGGFLPVALFLIYRQYTAGPPARPVLAVLCIVPVATVALAASNPLHGMIWDVAAGDRSVWFNRVYLPFVYCLFGYSMLALGGRLPSMARPHRKQVALLLTAASLPYAASMGSVLLGFGPVDFPVTASTFVLLLPIYWWAAVTLRVHELSPLAYRTLFERLRDPIVVLDRNRQIVVVNRAAQTLAGKPEGRLVGRSLREELPEVCSILDEKNGLDATGTVRMSPERYFEVTATSLSGPAGQDQGTVIVCRDVTERNEAQRALADSEHLVRSLIEHSSNGILRFARDPEDSRQRFRCVFANRAAQRFLGSEQSTLVGMPLAKLALLEPDRLLAQFERDVERHGSVSYETLVDIPDGEHWLRVIVEPVGTDISVTLVDITQRKRLENKILADALRDPLTGVLNRRGFEKEAGARLAGCAEAAVLYLDLNHFKSINDRFGHQAGDALLKAFGHRLGFCLRPEDVLGRLGGDEFAIVLPGVGMEDAKHVAERVVEAASDAYIIHGQEIGCTASVGIALMPVRGRELWSLIAAADQAMYDAKSPGQEDAANDRAANIEAIGGS